MKTCSIILADDHTIVREGLKSLLMQHPPFKIVADAKNGLEAVQKVREICPDLVIMDLSMPLMNGMEAIREIKTSCPDVKLLVLTVHKTEEYVIASLKAGADGYLLKDATQEELLYAIHTVWEGKPYISPDISQAIISGYLAWQKDRGFDSLLDTLTARERQVLKLVAEGHTSKEISDYLFISAKTVEKHRENLMRKLNIHSTSALTTFAIGNGLVMQ